MHIKQLEWVNAPKAYPQYCEIASISEYPLSFYAILANKYGGYTPVIYFTDGNNVFEYDLAHWHNFYDYGRITLDAARTYCKKHFEEFINKNVLQSTHNTDIFNNWG